MTPCILKPYDQQALYFHNSPLPYLILQDHTLQIIQANAAAITFFKHGATLENVAFPELVHQEARTTHEVLKKCETSMQPALLSCKTGRTVTNAQLFVSRIPGEEPLLSVMLVPAVLNHRDEEEKLLAGIVNESSDVLTASDLEFKPITWSIAAERLYGITREQALGANLRTYIDIQYKNSSLKEVRQQLLTTGIWRGEMSFVRPSDAKRMTLLNTFKLIRNPEGKPLHYVVSGVDITDRVEAEAKLQESENRFREVANSAPVGIWILHEEEITYVNKQLTQYIGLPDEGPFTLAVWISLIHPDDVDGVLKKFHHVVQHQQSLTLVYRIRHNSGVYRWVQGSGLPRRLPDGTFLGYVGSIVDIHDQKQREAQLQFQAMLMEHVLDSIITTDLNFHIQSCNQVARTLYGFTEAEMVGKRLSELIQFQFISSTHAEALEELEKTGVWQGEVDTEIRGELRNFLFTSQYITDAAGRRVNIMMVGREITDRKRAEQKLQQSEVFYRTLIANSVDGKLLTKIDGTITFASPAIQMILGFLPEDLNGRNAFEFVHPEDIAIAQQAFQLELQDTPEVKFIEIRLLKKDGTWLWCSVRGHNLLANPHIASMVISFHDDTQRKQAMDALKDSEQRFRALIKNLKLGVTLKDAHGKILMCNKAMADLVGVSKAALYKAHIYDVLKKIVHEDGTPIDRREWPAQRAISTKKPVRDVVLGITGTNSTELKWVLVNANPVLDEHGKVRHIITSFTDVTEHKKLNQRLLDERLNQQRLLTQASIDGQERERKEIGKELHDNIGQQLATTKLYLDLAKSMANPDAADMVTRATKSITDVINEVRTMSHSLVPPTLGDIGLVESVQELVNNMALLQNLKIDFKHTPFCEHGLLEKGKLMLYRIIQEALNNINKHAQASAVHIRLSRSTRSITLQIQDNGRGFAMDKIRKGLGLNNIRNRAELFGGLVRIRTAPGKGCTVHVLIPIKNIIELQAV